MMNSLYKDTRKILEHNHTRGRSRRIAKSLQESILIAFDFIWKEFLSDRNLATLLDLPLILSVDADIGILLKLLLITIMVQRVLDKSK